GFVRPQHREIAAGLAPGDREVLAHREAAKDAAPLRDQRDAERRDGLGCVAGHPAAVDGDRAVPGWKQADGHVHRRGLAGAVASEQTEEASLAEAQRHAVEHVAVAVECIDLLEREGVVRQGAYYTVTGGRIGACSARTRTGG